MGEKRTLIRLVDAPQTSNRLLRRRHARRIKRWIRKFSFYAAKWSTSFAEKAEWRSKIYSKRDISVTFNRYSSDNPYVGKKYLFFNLRMNRFWFEVPFARRAPVRRDNMFILPSPLSLARLFPITRRVKIAYREQVIRVSADSRFHICFHISFLFFPS